MTTLLMRPARRTTRLRVGALAAAAVLPFALTACGSDSDTGSGSTGGDPTASTGQAIDQIKKGFDGLLDSKSASFELSLQDDDGNLKKNIDTDADAAKVADTILGGKIRFTIDPAGDATLRDVSTFDKSKGISEQLKAANFSFAVEADGGDVAEIRFVQGVVYASADFDKIDGIAKKAGETGFDSFVAQAGSTPFGPAVKDLEAGKWLKLDATQFASQIEGLASSIPTPSTTAAVDGSQLVDDLVQAILPATTATGDDGSYDIEIKAKQALTSAATVLQRSGIPGFDRAFKASDLQQIPDTGVLKAKVEMDGDTLKSLKFDLESINTFMGSGDKTKFPLTNSYATLSVNDSADEISAPDNVSSVDLAALVKQFFGSFLSGFGGAAAGSGSSAGTTTG